MVSVTYSEPNASIAIPDGALKRAAVPVPFTKPGPSMVPTNWVSVVKRPVPDNATVAAAF